MDTLDIKQLAEHALGLTPVQTDTLIENGEDYDTPLQERFGVDLETFGKIASALIPLTPIIEDAHTHQLIHAFVEFHNGRGTIIVKQAMCSEPDRDEKVTV